MYYYATYPSPLGEITLLSNTTILLGLRFTHQRHIAHPDHWQHATLRETLPILMAKDWLSAYFAGKTPDPKLVPIQLHATPFQTEVFTQLQKIPYGTTVTYHELSQVLQTNNTKKKNYARAIGNALRNNPLLLVFPCHRVVASAGGLGGYVAGSETKRALLRLEGVNLTK
ncbi:MAG: methylated-DNA--[protein]-cysteine S-methyltransferase [Aerococcus sp.]|nr:methylated-DNA--[protein]-cysteine S-methyltransferase [Aerococcus sp.]